MKPLYLLPLLLTSLTLAQDDNPHTAFGFEDNNNNDNPITRSRGKNGKICPGEAWQDWCCVGTIEGPGLHPLKSYLSSLRSDHSDRDASHRSRLTSRVGSIAASLSSRIESIQSSLTSQIGDIPPAITARAELFPRGVTSIASGVTCFGSAVSFRANNFTEKVNSALAEKSTNPAAFNTTQSGEASGSLTGIVTTTEGSSNGTDITSTATLASQTDSAAGAGQSSSSVSTGAGAFITQAPILLVGGAAVMVGFM